jgi:hypothetical protein
MTEPLAVVLRIDETMLVMARFVVVAWVAVRVDAKNAVDVALVVVPLLATKLFKAESPVKVEDANDPFEMDGAVPNTSAPLPVSSPTRLASSVEVSILVDDTLLLKMVQSVEARYPFCAPVPTWMAKVLPEKVSGEEMVVGMREPLALVERRADGRPVIARAEVVPCPLENVRFEVDATVAKKEVVVAAVPVPVVKVNDLSVVEAESERLVATSVPVEVALPKRARVA